MGMREVKKVRSSLVLFDGARSASSTLVHFVNRMQNLESVNPKSKIQNPKSKITLASPSI